MGYQKTVLTYHGLQFSVNFLLQSHWVVGFKPQFINAYNPKYNGQIERFKRRIVSATCRFIVDHQEDWNIYTGPLAYVHNKLAHIATGYTPVELVLSLIPPELTM